MSVVLSSSRSFGLRTWTPFRHLSRLSDESANSASGSRDVSHFQIPSEIFGRLLVINAKHVEKRAGGRAERATATAKGLKAGLQLLVPHSRLLYVTPGVLDPKKGPTHLNVHVGDLHERREIYGSRQSGDRRLESANRLRATAGCRHLRVSG